MNTLASLIVALVLLAVASVAQTLEWLDRVEKYPRLKSFVEAKALRVIFLFVAVALLGVVLNDLRLISEALDKPPKSPPTPCINLKDLAACTTVATGESKPKTSQAQQQRNTGGNNSQQQSSGNNSPNISAPNGIAIGGGTVTNPTVNNFGPAARRLSKEQINLLVSCLSRNPGQFTVGSVANNSEAYQYATDWYQVFQAAHWKNEQAIPVATILISGGMWSGLRISLPGNEDTRTLMPDSPESNAYACFNAANLSGTVQAIVYKDKPEGTVRIDVSDNQ